MLATTASVLIAASATAVEAATLVMRSAEGVEAVFEEQDGRYRWSAYRDTVAEREWAIQGPLFSLQTPDGRRANLADNGARLVGTPGAAVDEVALEAELGEPPVAVRQVFTFCEDERTLRIRSSLRKDGQPITIQRVGLLEVVLPGESLERIGPSHVSSPIVSEAVFAGVEHPSALCQVDGEALYIAQHSYTTVGSEWTAVPAAVFGSASQADAAHGPEAVRRAFLRYLDTVRLKPDDLHVHYNGWWTMPVPYTEQDVLDNIAALKRGLYDRTGLFFDSYAMDMGWSDPHSVWEVNRAGYPDGFARIRDALAQVGSRPGLWVSPSSLYPPALDNAWLEEAGYEVSPGSHIGHFACLARGGRYQRAFKRAVLKHARNGNLAHVKFDGLAWPCSVESHGHPVDFESCQPIAEGLAEVFDALRRQDPAIALEPTCLGYYPSPWWLMHTPFVIGPFGDDSPRGQCPAPDWLESMTTARDIAALRGRDAFWMPSTALECFDIIIQCPGDFANHAVAAIGRGHWFLSTYINPMYMAPADWRFFANLIRWARDNRERLQDPVVFGGDPAERQAYGYAHLNGDQPLYFARNPWIEAAAVALPDTSADHARDLVMLYPRKAVVARAEPGEAFPEVGLGPYELVVLEARRAGRAPVADSDDPVVGWTAEAEPVSERLIYPREPPAYGPSWTSPEGEADAVLTFAGSGRLSADVEAEVCVLVETPPETPPGTCVVTVDGVECESRETGSRGAFYAAQARPEDDWQWFLATIPPGEHKVAYRVHVPSEEVRCGVYVRGPVTKLGAPRAAAFPARRPGPCPWSRTLAPVSGAETLGLVERHVERRIVEIDGVYLDSLDWLEATAGWGEVRRNQSVMERPMTMGGRAYRRGIGTHAPSRIVYDVPPGMMRFAATIGCDQEVAANSVVFTVEGDGRELYRSPLMRVGSSPIDVDIAIDGVERLVLGLEDGGDGIAADHGDWADARFLR